MTTTASSLDPRSLARRLTATGHALQHRLLTQLRDADLDPRTVAILRTIAGDAAPAGLADRISRGGKRVRALAEHGWITRTDDGWALTDDGRAVLDRADTALASVRDELSAALPDADLAALAAAVDVLADALGADDRMPFGPRGRDGFGRADRGVFGPADHGFGRGHGFGPDRGFGRGHGFGPSERHGFGPSTHGETCGRRGHESDPRRHGGHRAAQRAYERGFDAGFARGREATASA